MPLEIGLNNTKKKLKEKKKDKIAKGRILKKIK